MSMQLQVGKLPPELLRNLLNEAPVNDPDIVIGPGIGLDCAVVEDGDRLLVYTSDPITFTTENMGWYCVQINANDVVTTGAIPRWFLVTYLLPERSATSELVDRISTQVYRACQELDVAVLGGHTEITAGLERPLLVGTMVGEVSREDLVTPAGARPGDHVLLTKGVPIESTAILSRDFPERLHDSLSQDEIRTAQKYLYNPGISVMEDARIACRSGKVTAMHDPTEGGVAAALWEMAEACGYSFVVQPAHIFVSRLSNRICQSFQISPFASIASGALLITALPDAVAPIVKALREHGILCSDIGVVEEGPVGVWQTDDTERRNFPYPRRDEITKIYENA